MTAKIARRGVRVSTEYAADYLDKVLVRDSASRNVTTLKTSDVHRHIRIRQEIRKRLRRPTPEDKL